MKREKQNGAKAGPPGLQKREDPRIFSRYSVPIFPVRFKNLKAGERGVGHCRDIGGGGACFEGPRELSLRTPLELWFELPDRFPALHLLGRVVWKDKINSHWKTGIRFDRQKLIALSRILSIK